MLRRQTGSPRSGQWSLSKLGGRSSLSLSMSRKTQSRDGDMFDDHGIASRRLRAPPTRLNFARCTPSEETKKEHKKPARRSRNNCVNKQQLFPPKFFPLCFAITLPRGEMAETSENFRPARIFKCGSFSPENKP